MVCVMERILAEEKQEAERDEMGKQREGTGGCGGAVVRRSCQDLCSIHDEPK